jgi:hypothetical protein
MRWSGHVRILTWAWVGFLWAGQEIGCLWPASAVTWPDHGQGFSWNFLDIACCGHVLDRLCLDWWLAGLLHRPQSWLSMASSGHCLFSTCSGAATLWYINGLWGPQLGLFLAWVSHRLAPQWPGPAMCEASYELLLPSSASTMGCPGDCLMWSRYGFPNACCRSGLGWTWPGLAIVWTHQGLGCLAASLASALSSSFLSWRGSLAHAAHSHVSLCLLVAMCWSHLAIVWN